MDNTPKKEDEVTSNKNIVPQFKIVMTCGKDGDDYTNLYDGLYKALEPFGNNMEQFTALISAAYLYVDPCNDMRFSDANLISLAKENNGETNAYTDLLEMIEAFDASRKRAD